MNAFTYPTGLRAGPSRVRTGPDRRRAGPAQVGRDQPVAQWDLAGAGSPWPVDQGQALWAGGRLCRSTPAAAVGAPPERHLQVDHPGELVQFDCFCIGRLSGTKGTVWQYTAIDVASAYTWATLQVTRRNPSATWTSQLARQVAADLAARGWRLERVMSDNASQLRSATFAQTIAALGARHTFIRAGRPQTNGCVERVQQTILEECWKPAFARYLIPKQTGLKLDLERYLRYYNTERAHTGRWTKGRTPDEVLGKAKLWQKKR